MIRYDPRELARTAVAAHPARPAMTLALDTADARLIVFRIAPGQAVPPHASSSTVILTVVSGTGTVSGAEGDLEVAEGDVVAFGPREPHGMRATTTELVLLATIAPRPGER
jgi:quercetin dioxygenase-like cupin family protein